MTSSLGALRDPLGYSTIESMIPMSKCDRTIASSSVPNASRCPDRGVIPVPDTPDAPDWTAIPCERPWLPTWLPDWLVGNAIEPQTHVPRPNPGTTRPAEPVIIPGDGPPRTPAVPAYHELPADARIRGDTGE